MGIAVAIKPHYALMWVLLELPLAARRRSIFFVIRPETLACRSPPAEQGSIERRK